MRKINCRKFTFLIALFAIQVSIAFSQNAIRLDIDATDAGKNIIHVREKMSVSKAGEFSLFFPKWIPGEHAPTGTLNDMVNLYITANGKAINWRRDDVEMFEFHLTIPENVKEIEIAFDDVSQPGTIASANLSRIKWNRLILYPEGAKADNVNVTASLKFPNGWQYATALKAENETANPAQFKTVSLTRLVDSPAIIGKFFKKIKLTDANGVSHEMDIAADSAEALEYKPETLEGWKNLVTQANLTFGARHYNSYKFLNTFSDVGGGEGLEHNESSENGVGLEALSDEYRLLDLSELLGHEFAHSWNGKYRRPNGLATGDYETPQKAEMLWVYEGLTQYLGKVLPTRAGLWTPEMFRDVMADTAADLDYQTGRRWRPLADTAVAVQFTYDSPRAWRNERRRVDYYDEGALIWMEADVLIRQKSGGKLSLNDFLRKFHGGQNTGAMIKPYDLNEIVTTLNSVVPFDWRTFFEDRVYKIQKNAPVGGITNGGWKLVYNETPNLQAQMYESIYDFANFTYSIGITVDSDGEITDINPDLAAAKAGIVPGMKITKINGADEEFSLENLHKAIASTKNNQPLEFEIEFSGETKTYKLDYKGGERYPHLERDSSKTDYLTEITKPLVADTFEGVPPGFRISSDPISWSSSSSSLTRTTRQSGIVNKPPDVTNLVLNRTEITANCAANSNLCKDEKRTIEIFTEAVDPENDVLTYEYTLNGGKIIGFGAKVVWDLSGLKPGTYTITAGANDGCGICGATKTMTVTVKQCPDCN